MNTTDVLNSFDLSTRHKRRTAVSFVLKLLDKICVAEELNISRIPENFHRFDTYAASANSIDTIRDAVAYLNDAY
jgi:hypothetical protein